MTEKLSTAERDAHLAPLLGNGWSLEAERDAITKIFKFKNRSLWLDDTGGNVGGNAQSSSRMAQCL